MPVVMIVIVMIMWFFEMIIAVAMPVAATAQPVIGPIQRIERGDFGKNNTAQPLHHIAHDMIINDAKPPVFQDLKRGMTVADMPCHFGRRNRAGTGDGQDVLGSRTHHDHPAINQTQLIPVAQTHRMGQIKQKRIPGIIHQPDAPPVTVGKGKCYRTAHFGCVGLADRDMFNRATHDPGS
tara:strand:+ start:1608 stop:2147 length:540 start_codon:yes stop_codon:yes gene_type:complete